MPVPLCNRVWNRGLSSVPNYNHSCFPKISSHLQYNDVLLIQGFLKTFSQSIIIFFTFSQECLTLVRLLLMSQDTICWVAYKQQKLLFQLWMLGSPRTGSQPIRCLMRIRFLFIDSCPLTMSSQGRSGKGTLWSPFHKGTNPTNKSPTLEFNSFPEASPLITWGIALNIWILEGAQPFSLQSSVLHLHGKL